MSRAALVAGVTAALLLTGCTASAPVPTPPTTTAERTTVPNPELDAALIKAAWANDLATAKDLIERGADVNAQDDTRQSAFLIAASEGYTELLWLTLAHGADVASLDSYDGTALIRAAERGHADIVGLLIQHGVAVDHVNNLGWTALHEALEFAELAGGKARSGAAGYLDTVRLLVAARADVTLPARDGATSVELANRHGLQAHAALLERAAGAQPDADAAARLLAAAGTGDTDAAALALHAGADLETRNELQQTPLLVASAADRVEVARLPVRLGADPDAVDHQQDTPWLVTGVTGSVAMLEVLLPAEPDLSLRNRFGGLSPILAAERGHVEYIRRVVQTDVDLNHVNNLGWTALLEAVILGDGGTRHQQVVQILVDAGVDTSIADRDGVTALQHAQRRGYTEIARILRG